MKSIRRGWGYIPGVAPLEEVHHFLQVVPLDLHSPPFHRNLCIQMLNEVCYLSTIIPPHNAFLFALTSEHSLIPN